MDNNPASTQLPGEETNKTPNNPQRTSQYPDSVVKILLIGETGSGMKQLLTP
jgi:hypothetical protein